MPINQLTQQGNFLLAALAGAERIFAVMDQKPEIDEGTVELVQRAGKQRRYADRVRQEHWAAGPGCDRRRTGLSPLIPLRGDVRFHARQLWLHAGAARFCRTSRLYAKPGQKIAFVGSTGAGKTTITNLINRFYEVPGGVHHLRRHRCASTSRRTTCAARWALCLQDTHLFTGTVADNIRFGKLDATQAEIEQPRPRLPTPTPSSAACRRATTRW